jgi:hypothetical protein
VNKINEGHPASNQQAASYRFFPEKFEHVFNDNYEYYTTF